MFETATNSNLATWRCPRWPPNPNDSFTPLGDHRSAYLEYQGEISNHRGQVARIASGELLSLEISPHRLLITLDTAARISLPR